MVSLQALIYSRKTIKAEVQKEEIAVDLLWIGERSEDD